MAGCATGKCNDLLLKLGESLPGISPDDDERTYHKARDLLTIARQLQMNYEQPVEFNETDDEEQQMNADNNKSQNSFSKAPTPVLVAWEEDGKLCHESVHLQTAPHGAAAIPLISPMDVMKMEEDMFSCIPTPCMGRLGASDVLLLADKAFFDDSLLMHKLNIDVAGIVSWDCVNVLERIHDAPSQGYAVHYKERVKNENGKFDKIPRSEPFESTEDTEDTEGDIADCAGEILASAFELHASGGHAWKVLDERDDETGEVKAVLQGDLACIVLGKDSTGKYVPYKRSIPFRDTNGNYVLKNKAKLSEVLRIAFDTQELTGEVDERVLYVSKFSKLDVLFIFTMDAIDPLLFYKLNLESFDPSKSSSRCDAFWLRMQDHYNVGRSFPYINMTNASVLVPSIYNAQGYTNKRKVAENTSTDSEAGPSKPKKRRVVGKKKKAQVEANMNARRKEIDTAIESAMRENKKFLLGTLIKAFMSDVCSKSMDASVDNANQVLGLLLGYSATDPSKVFDAFSDTELLEKLQKCAGVEDDEIVSQVIKLVEQETS